MEELPIDIYKLIYDFFDISGDQQWCSLIQVSKTIHMSLIKMTNEFRLDPKQDHCRYLTIEITKDGAWVRMKYDYQKYYKITIRKIIIREPTVISDDAYDGVLYFIYIDDYLMEALFPSAAILYGESILPMDKLGMVLPNSSNRLYINKKEKKVYICIDGYILTVPVNKYTPSFLH